jgi:hypothetical protein
MAINARRKAKHKREIRSSREKGTGLIPRIYSVHI